MTPKIATCCYCGTRAALRLDAARHELTCSNCGAPLHNLKRMALDPVRPPEERESKPKRSRKTDYRNSFAPLMSKPKRRKKRKSLLNKVWKEVLDEIEDIFD